jgi:pyrophosphatase PpaX
MTAGTPGFKGCQLHNTKPSFTTYLFDLDGTLIDSVDLILTCYRYTVKKHLGEVPPDEIWMAGLGTPLRKQLAEFTEDPEEIEAMATTYREYHYQHHDELLKQYPGVLEAVRALDRPGKKFGVVTSKMPWSTRRGIEICGFDGLFGALVTAKDVKKHKPHPEPVHLALELLDAKASETVFVGDSPHDMAAGRAAGVKTAAALWGPFDRPAFAPHEPDYWLETPADLSQLR